MKKLAFVFFLAVASLNNANAYSEKISYSSQKWTVVIARSLDGKQLRIRYKVSHFVRETNNAMADVQYWDNYANKWTTAYGLNKDNYGNYVTYYSTKYYF